MALVVNGQTIPDGGNVYVNGVKPDSIVVNGTTVWRNNVPPSQITDLKATTNRISEVVITFTPASGVPTPTHNLYENGVLVAENITSGYQHLVSAGERTYHIEACNSAGCTTSNSDVGYSVPAGGLIIDYYTANDLTLLTYNGNGSWTFTPPEGQTEFYIEVQGAGGSGGNNNYINDDAYSGGGYAGEYKTATLTITSATDITIGKGGAGVIPGYSGNAGGASSIASVTAAGGDGGWEASDCCYEGRGEGNDGNYVIDNCFYRDGCGYMAGGQGSHFGKGGDGNGQHGETGAGGGSMAHTFGGVSYSGDGGDGRVVINFV
jgi:hypothetical protein